MAIGDGWGPKEWKEYADLKHAAEREQISRESFEIVSAKNEKLRSKIDKLGSLSEVYGLNETLLESYVSDQELEAFRDEDW